MNEEWTYEEKVSYVTRVITGEATSEEIVEFEKWSQDPDNLAVYNEINQLWDVAGTVKGARSSEVERAWNRIQEDIQQTQPTSSRTWIWYAAASAAILVVVSVLFFLPAGQQMYETAGTMKVIELQDGSEVTLNAYSKLTIDQDFNELSREVELEGEAFFDVERDEDRPFIISTAYASVEVLGTSFNVAAYGDNREVVVVVTTGKVKVSGVQSGTDVTLEKGDRATVSRANGEVESLINDDVNYLSWKTKEIVFEDLTLREAALLLEKVYLKEITLSDKALETCTITANFSNQSLAEVLTVISVSLDLEIIETSEGFELRGDGC